MFTERELMNVTGLSIWLEPLPSALAIPTMDTLTSFAHTCQERKVIGQTDQTFPVWIGEEERFQYQIGTKEIQKDLIVQFRRKQSLFLVPLH